MLQSNLGWYSIYKVTHSAALPSLFPAVCCQYEEQRERTRKRTVSLCTDTETTSFSNAFFNVYAYLPEIPFVREYLS